MSKLYRKRPDTFEALQFTGKNVDEILNFIGRNGDAYESHGSIVIEKRKETIVVFPGEYVIIDDNDEEAVVFKCRPEVFKAKYEPIEKDSK